MKALGTILFALAFGAAGGWIGVKLSKQQTPAVHWQPPASDPILARHTNVFDAIPTNKVLTDADFGITDEMKIADLEKQVAQLQWKLEAQERFTTNMIGILFASCTTSEDRLLVLEEKQAAIAEATSTLLVSALTTTRKPAAVDNTAQTEILRENLLELHSLRDSVDDLTEQQRDAEYQRRIERLLPK